MLNSSNFHPTKLQFQIAVPNRSSTNIPVHVHVVTVIATGSVKKIVGYTHYVL